MANLPIDWSKVSDEALAAFIKRNEERLAEQMQHLEEEYVASEIHEKVEDEH